MRFFSASALTENRWIDFTLLMGGLRFGRFKCPPSPKKMNKESVNYVRTEFWENDILFIGFYDFGDFVLIPITKFGRCQY